MKFERNVKAFRVDLRVHKTTQEKYIDFIILQANYYLVG